MAKRTLQFHAYAPIPVGHRVEVTFFGREKLKLFGKGEIEANRDEPMIEDLDSGVVYQAHWHSTNDTGLTSGHAQYPLGVSEDLTVAETVTGRVLQCRVLAAHGYERTTLVTTLIVEDEPEAQGPHR
jgi:hypothetical protein